jgi:lipopolysaccharide transport system permease protein
MPRSNTETQEVPSAAPVRTELLLGGQADPLVPETGSNHDLGPGLTGVNAPAPTGEIVIRRRRGWQSLELHELWQYRQLLLAFLARDIKARQKQTVLGFIWLVASPLFSVAVFSIVFGRLAKIPSDDIPYPLFVFAGQVIWNTFAHVLTQSTNSVVANGHFVQKIYFPRLLIPVSAGISGIVDTVVMFVALLGMMLFFGRIPPPTALLGVPIIILLMATGMGIGFFLAPLNVKYRDVGYLVGYGIQLGLYLTPVVYPVSLVPERFRWLLALNPVAGYVDAFRWCLYGTAPSPELIAASLVTTVLVFVGGAFFYARMQGSFADNI